MDRRILSYYVEKFSMDTTIIIGLDVLFIYYCGYAADWRSYIKIDEAI